jgi:hypothetical protein
MIGACIRRTCAALLLLPALASAQPRSDKRPLTISQYVAQLDTLASAIEQADADHDHPPAAMDDLPDVWRVDGLARTFEIPTAPLRVALRDWRTSHKATGRQHAIEQLHMLRTDAVSFEAPSAERPSQRALLTSILSGPDFRDVRGPTWIDAQWQRVLGFLARSLKLFLPTSTIPTIGAVIVYALIGTALLLAARFFGRFFTRTEAATGAPDQQTPSVPSWPQWLSGAQAAASRGEWRDAVHLAYWCAVSFLEEKGAWRPDRARTPREYLRLLPSSSADAAALAALTHRFELVWYGAAHVDEQVYTESIQQLKKLGCPTV